MARVHRASAALSGLLAVTIGVMVNYVSARHFRRADWTAARMYTLSDKTRGVLETLRAPVQVTVFMIPDLSHDVYRFTSELCEQFKRYGGEHLRVETIDVDKQPDRAQLLARKYKIDGEDLREGVVVFDSEGREKYVTKNDLVEYDYASAQPGEPPRMRAWKGEAAFAQALLTVTDTHKPTICFAVGHGEASPEDFEEEGYSVWAEELKRDDYAVKTVPALARLGSEGCDALVVGGPQRAWQGPEVAALGGYLGAGGRALFLMGAVTDRGLTRWLRVGLEPLLEKYGVKLGDEVVVDPEHGHLLAGASVWSTETYAVHPTVARLAGRITYWPQPRSVQATGKDATETVRSSPTSWGEADLVSIGEGKMRFDAATDRKGPLPVAVAVEQPGGARLVVVGTRMLVENYRLKGDVLRDYNVDFAGAQIAWLLGRAPLIAVGAKTPEHVKLTLSPAQLHGVAWFTIGGLPLSALLLGGYVWWRRQR
jgi:hypothetical protein